MSSLMLIGLIAGVPVLLATLLRVNSVFLFLSVAAGALLNTTLNGSVELFLGMFIKGTSMTELASYLLLGLPVLLTLIFLRKTARPAIVIMQLLPLVATGAVFGILILGAMPGHLQTAVYDSQLGGTIRQSPDLAIGVAAVLNLMMTWLVFRNNEHHKRHYRH